LAVDDEPRRLVDDHVLHPAHLGQDACQRVHLVLRIDTPVLGIGQKALCIHLIVAHNAVSPLARAWSFGLVGLTLIGVAGFAFSGLGDFVID